MPVPQAWDLSGRKALVTIGARAWAPTLARALAEAGADVAVAAATAEVADEAAAEVRAAGRKAFAVGGRWDTDEVVEQAVRQVVGELMGLHILVNGPAGGDPRPFRETGDDEWAAQLDSALLAPVRWSRAAGKHFAGQRQGRIVNILSVVAERGLANASAFAASQAALRAVTQSLALEWARMGVTVNAIGTGWFEAARRPVEEQQKERLVRYLPLRRRGHPADVAALLAYLASDASGFVTGQTVYVDGGAMAHA